MVLYTDLLEADNFFDEAVEQSNYALSLIRKVFNGVHPEAFALQEKIKRI